MKGGVLKFLNHIMNGRFMKKRAVIREVYGMDSTYEGYFTCKYKIKRYRLMLAILLPVFVSFIILLLTLAGAGILLLSSEPEGSMNMLFAMQFVGILCLLGSFFFYILFVNRLKNEILWYDNALTECETELKSYRVYEVIERQMI